MPQDYHLDLSKARVASRDRPYEDGIVLREGRTTPFRVERAWSGPAGTYNEQWSIRRGGAEILYRHPPQLIGVTGMQATSEFSDVVDQPLDLEPGTYKLVFIVEGRFMGAADIEVRESKDQAA